MKNYWDRFPSVKWENFLPKTLFFAWLFSWENFTFLRNVPSCKQSSPQLLRSVQRRTLPGEIKCVFLRSENVREKAKNHPCHVPRAHVLMMEFNSSCQNLYPRGMPPSNARAISYLLQMTVTVFGFTPLGKMWNRSVIQRVLSYNLKQLDEQETLAIF